MGKLNDFFKSLDKKYQALDKKMDALFDKRRPCGTFTKQREEDEENYLLAVPLRNTIYVYCGRPADDVYQIYEFPKGKCDNEPWESIHYYPGQWIEIHLCLTCMQKSVANGARLIMPEGWPITAFETRVETDMLCMFCKHYHGNTAKPLSCDAFPDGIPRIFLNPRFPGPRQPEQFAEHRFRITHHTKPYEGDHGLQYEPFDIDEDPASIWDGGPNST